MWDGSAVPLEENLQIAQDLLKKAAEAKIVLEVEIGVVGGEEDGVEGGGASSSTARPRTRSPRSRLWAPARAVAT
jgi:fructose/tagatose bisphosphate aldolase